MTRTTGPFPVSHRDLSGLGTDAELERYLNVVVSLVVGAMVGGLAWALGGPS